ncbi:hypothetical protein GOM49_15995 [Clostridium bovifaecis]|uniref:Uncharacterized protein n=1 Tax=Clostridium bovifaecis TaxID=2184719 RepID=A0A6I6EVL7_9CLOT|nr:hypothetical protein GOM49_15995 [Clostridium bovifaecis]
MSSDIVKIFSKILESKFYQTLISVLLTFMTFFFISDDMAIVKRFGHFWGAIFIFVCWILIIETILITWKNIKKVYTKACDNQYRDVQREKQNKEILESLWTRIDEMSNVEKEKLKYFLNNNNQPLLEGNVSYSYGHLLNSDWVHKTQYTSNEQIKQKVNIIKNGQTKIEEFVYSPKYQYVLQEHIYEALKYSLEKYGRISHFD